MKEIALSLVWLCMALVVCAQEPVVPVNYKLEKPDDFSKYEPQVVQAINWINETPLDQQQDKRKQMNAFLLQWMSGSPTVHLEIKQEIVTFIGSPDLLMIFMGGWTKYSLESKDFNNKVAGNLAGVEAVIAFYQKNRKAIGKDKAVEKYIKLKESGKLQAYIEENT